MKNEIVNIVLIIMKYTIHNGIINLTRKNLSILIKGSFWLTKSIFNFNSKVFTTIVIKNEKIKVNDIRDTKLEIIAILLK